MFLAQITLNNITVTLTRKSLEMHVFAKQQRENAPSKIRGTVLSRISFIVLKIALCLQSMRSVQITVYLVGISLGRGRAIESGGNSGE